MAKSVGKQGGANKAQQPPGDLQGEEDRWGARNHRSLSMTLIVVGWIGMLVFAFHACTRMVAAGDTWVAMACGRHFINNGVDTVEPFSANSHAAGPSEEDVEDLME